MSWYNLIVFIIMFATVGSLIVGVVSMVNGGTFDDKHSVHFMFVRVALQALAVLVMMVVIFYGLMG